jgi:hypothetical protein
MQSWPLTIRLCVILLVGAVATSGVGAAVAELIRHLL